MVIGNACGNAVDNIRNLFRKNKSTCIHCGKEIFDEDKGICSLCRTRNNLDGKKMVKKTMKAGVLIGVSALFGYSCVQKNSNDNGEV